VWFSGDGSIWGFQLCYGRDKRERGLTWRSGHGYSHARVDDGEGPGLDYKRTPILAEDGTFDADRVLRVFLESAAALPKFIVDFVAERIERYPEGGTSGN
jgi:hypothetical protein